MRHTNFRSTRVWTNIAASATRPSVANFMNAAIISCETQALI